LGAGLLMTAIQRRYGPTGPAGLAGSQILSSTTAPDPLIGAIGDFYLNKTTNQMYGPKTQENEWGTPINLGDGNFELTFDLDLPEDGQVISFDAGQGLWIPTDIVYTHTQSLAATTWTVNHNLGFFPGGVSVIDSGENVVFGDIGHQNANTLTITFTTAFGGKAFLS